jgi:hypothetical protein
MHQLSLQGDELTDDQRKREEQMPPEILVTIMEVMTNLTPDFNRVGSQYNPSYLDRLIERGSTADELLAHAVSDDDPAEDVATDLSGPILQWSDIAIVFTSDHRIQVTTPTKRETLNYGDMGFEDKRGPKSSGKPKKAWMLLLLLAERNGTFPRDRVSPHQRTMLEKRMQELRRFLRAHFCLPGDPLPFVKGVGYEAAFKISKAPSFNT